MASVSHIISSETGTKVYEISGMGLLGCVEGLCLPDWNNSEREPVHAVCLSVDTFPGVRNVDGVAWLQRGAITVAANDKLFNVVHGWVASEVDSEFQNGNPKHWQLIAEVIESIEVLSEFRDVLEAHLPSDSYYEGDVYVFGDVEIPKAMIVA